MDSALSKLYLCHSLSNAGMVKCGTMQRSKVVVGAATAASPLTQTQRALLHTAIQRSRPTQHQQQQQLSPQELQLRANMLQLQRLIAQTQSRQQAAQQLQQASQPVQTHASDDGPSKQPPPAVSHPAQQQQQHQSGRSNAGPVDLQQQQQQQQQQHLLQQQMLLRQLLQQQQVRQRRLQLQLKTEPAVLTSLIKRCQSWRPLQHLFNTYTAYFNAVHVSAALTHLAQLQGPISPAGLDQQPEGLKQLMRDLTSAAAACIPDYGPRQLANTIWAIGKLGCGLKVTKRLRSSYLKAFMQKLPGAAPQHISNVALAVANMGWGTSTEWQQLLLQEAQAKQQYFKPQEAANLLYSLPLLGVQPSQQWLSNFFELCCNNMPGFKSQELSMLGVALVRLKQRPSEQWLSSYMQAVQTQLEATTGTVSSSNPNSTTSSSSGARYHGRNHQPIQQQQPAEQEGSRSLNSQQAAGFQAQGLVNVLWVLAVWHITPDAHWQSSCLAAVRQLLPHCNIQGLSTLFWALTRLQVPLCSILSDQLLHRCQLLLPTANPTDTAMLVWSLGTCGVRYQQGSSSGSNSSSSSSDTTASWGDATTLMATQALCKGVLYRSRRTLTSASSRDVVSLLVGAVRMRLRPGAGWLHAVAVEAHHNLPSMNSVELSSTLLCLTRLKHTPRISFMTTFCSRSLDLLQKTAGDARNRRHSTHSTHSSIPSPSVDLELYSPQSLVNTVGALAILQYQPPKAWSRGFLAASRQLLPRFTARDFAYCIWALAMLEIRPPQLWMDEFLVQLRQHISTMATSELSATIWALAKLNHRPGVDWMQRFLDRVVALTSSSSNNSSSSSSSQCRLESTSGRLESTSDSRMALSHAGSAPTSRKSRRAREASVPAAVAAAAAVSEPAAAANPPRTPLQLSADFSSIILHGLTMWATSRLEYQAIPSANSCDSEGLRVEAVELTAPMHSSSSSNRSSSSSSHSQFAGSQKGQLNGSVSSETAADTVATSTSRDDYIVFHF